MNIFWMWDFLNNSLWLLRQLYNLVLILYNCRKCVNWTLPQLCSSSNRINQFCAFVMTLNVQQKICGIYILHLILNIYFANSCTFRAGVGQGDGRCDRSWNSVNDHVDRFFPNIFFESRCPFGSRFVSDVFDSSRRIADITSFQYVQVRIIFREFWKTVRKFIHRLSNLWKLRTLICTEFAC